MAPEQTLASRIAATVSIGFLLLAVFGRWSQGFYIVLQFVVCGAAIYFAQQAGTFGQTAWVVFTVVIAVLFNPIVRVHLSRSAWRVTNLIPVGLFAVLIVKARP